MYVTAALSCLFCCSRASPDNLPDRRLPADGRPLAFLLGAALLLQVSGLSEHTFRPPEAS